MFQANIHQYWKYFQVFHLTFFQVCMYISQTRLLDGRYIPANGESYLSCMDTLRMHRVADRFSVSCCSQTVFIASSRVSFLMVSSGPRCQWAVTRALFLRSARAGTSEGFLVQELYDLCKAVCMEEASHRLRDFLPTTLGSAWYLSICSFSQCQLQVTVKFI